MGVRGDGSEWWDDSKGERGGRIEKGNVRIPRTDPNLLDTIHKSIAYAYASLRGQLRKTDAGEAWLKKTTVTW